MLQIKLSHGRPLLNQNSPTFQEKFEITERPMVLGKKPMLLKFKTSYLCQLAVTSGEHLGVNWGVLITFIQTEPLLGIIDILLYVN